MHFTDFGWMENHHRSLTVEGLLYRTLHPRSQTISPERNLHFGTQILATLRARDMLAFAVAAEFIK